MLEGTVTPWAVVGVTAGLMIVALTLVWAWMIGDGPFGPHASERTDFREIRRAYGADRRWEEAVARGWREWYPDDTGCEEKMARLRKLTSPKTVLQSLSEALAAAFDADERSTCAYCGRAFTTWREYCRSCGAPRGR